MRGADDNLPASMGPLLCVEGLYAAYREIGRAHV